MRVLTKVILIFSVLLTNQMFSQTFNKVELRQDNLLPERIIPQSISDEQINHPLKSDIFNNKESRTLVNKTILDNGFLLIEQLNHRWDGSNWVNDWKNTYTYDGNNNKTEELYQRWDGSNLANWRKNTYTYDGNNNKTEELSQYWRGSAWVNGSKTSYTYD